MSAHPSFSPVRILSVLCCLGAVSTCLCLLTGLAGAWHWTLDLFSHFRVQYVFALLLCGGILLALKKWRRGLVILTLGLITGTSLLPYWMPPLKPQKAGPSLKILSYNVHTDNRNSPEVIRFIRSQNPDICFLMEVDARWARELDCLRNQYPFIESLPREDNFGIMLLSRIPIESSGILYFSYSGVPSLALRLNLGNKTINLLGTHPLPPVSSYYAGARDMQLAQIAEWIHQHPEPTILVSDLNATPWSAHWKKLTQSAALRDSAVGHGLPATWIPIWFMRIPIDHILHTHELLTLTRHVGSAMGSDHRPVIATMALDSSK